MNSLLILAPLAIEARALRRGLRLAAAPAWRLAPQAGADSGTVEVLRTGMGPKAATRFASRLPDLAAGAAPVVVAGFGGGLRSDIHTGDVIVGTEVRGPGGVIALPAAAARALAGSLRSAGLTVRVGPIVSSERAAMGDRRAALARGGGANAANRRGPTDCGAHAPNRGSSAVHRGAPVDRSAPVDCAVAADCGALAVDMESYWLLESHYGPAAVVRAVSDTAGAWPLGGMLPLGWLRAYRSLVKVAAVLEGWAAAMEPTTG
jgi:4-hydroxy-3-methylbut-2-en-1-yl diphosphate reductase